MPWASLPQLAATALQLLIYVAQSHHEPTHGASVVPLLASDLIPDETLLDDCHYIAHLGVMFSAFLCVLTGLARLSTFVGLFLFAQPKKLKGSFSALRSTK